MHKTASPDINTAGHLPEADRPDFTLKDRLARLRHTLVGAFGIMMLAVTLANALNYVFSIIMTRMLGETGAFATFNTLNALFMIVAMGALAMQTVVTKNVAEYQALEKPDRTRSFIHHFSRWLVIASAGILAVSAALAWPLASVLKLDSPVYVLIVGLSVAVALYATIPYGLLQGEQRFLGLGAASISQSALRIVLGVVLVGVGLGVYGALGAAALAGIATIAVIVYYYRGLFFRKPAEAGDFHPGRALLALLPVATAVFLVIFMTQVDVVLVKALESPFLADLYSYGALAGKAVLFFPGGIVLVMFPRVSAMRAGGKPTRGVLAWSLGACLLLEGAVVGFYALFPGFTRSFFAGRHGGEIANLTGLGMDFVVLFGLVMAVFALLNVLVYYHLAMERRAFMALLAAGAAAEVVGILLFHETLPQVLLVMLSVGFVLLVANLLLALVERPGGARADFSDTPEMPII